MRVRPEKRNSPPKTVLALLSAAHQGGAQETALCHKFDKLILHRMNG